MTTLYEPSHALRASCSASLLRSLMHFNLVTGHETNAATSTRELIDVGLSQGVMLLVTIKQSQTKAKQITP